MSITSIKQTDDNAHIIKLEFGSRVFEYGVTLVFDPHWDSAHCNRRLLAKVCDRAKEKSQPIIIGGDLFDVMQSRHDPRRCAEDLRDEFHESPYLNLVVEKAADWWEPYADNLMLVMNGNHEDSVTQNNGYDPTRGFIREMELRHNTKIERGWYTHWIVWQTSLNGKGNRLSSSWFLDHGSGGNAPQTLGVLNFMRDLKHYAADVMVKGHNHNSFQFDIGTERLTTHGKVERGECLCVNVPSMKKGKRKAGYAAKKGFPPLPMGAVEITLHTELGKDNRYQLKAKAERIN